MRQLLVQDSLRGSQCRIHFAADVVQKNYLELRKESQDITLDKILQVCIEKGQRVSKSELLGKETVPNSDD